MTFRPKVTTDADIEQLKLIDSMRSKCNQPNIERPIAFNHDNIAPTQWGALQEFGMIEVALNSIKKSTKELEKKGAL